MTLNLQIGNCAKLQKFKSIITTSLRSVLCLCDLGKWKSTGEKKIYSKNCSLQGAALSLIEVGNTRILSIWR